MRKILTASSLVILLFLVACASNTKTILRGCYQSEREGIGYVVVISFQQDNGGFIEYIDNREVDRGTYEKIKDNVYEIKSDKQSLEVTLNAKNSFDIIIKKLNNGKSIQLKNVSDAPVEFSTRFNDVDKYKALLE